MSQDWDCIEWRGLYGEGWGTEIVPEAFAHPAKYSRALIRRIYQEMLERGWLAEGDTVIDPFGGVALGGLDAMLAGLHWQGCELEPRFVALGQANIDLWNRRYAAQMPHWGTARIVQGDSRRLRCLLADSAGVITSPPYSGSSPEAHGPGIDLRKNYETYRASGGGSSWDKFVASRARHQDGYGKTDGQLGAMPEGEVGAAIGSPPYAEGLGHGGGTSNIPHDTQGTAQAMRDGYGQTPGQLAGMKSDGFSATVGSPPYAADEKHDHTHDQRDDRRGKRQGRGSFRGQYGKTDGQLAAMPAGEPIDDRAGGAVSSPPYNLPMSQDHNGKRGGKRGTEPSETGAFARYGDTDGQLEGMTPGDLDAAIASPPFLQTSGGTNVTSTDGPLSDARLIGRHAAGNAAAEAYGSDAGNLGNMREGTADYSAALSSPPFEQQQKGGGLAKPDALYLDGTRIGQNCGYQNGAFSEHNLGNGAGDTFWSAARAIVAETFAVLRPGAHAAWVVKGFVRNRKLVDFPDQWRQLCESVGFVTIAEVRAWVVEDKGTQLAMHGDDKRHVTERKSFFRRLAESKGSPRIDYETVWLMEKI